MQPVILHKLGPDWFDAVHAVLPYSTGKSHNSLCDKPTQSLQIACHVPGVSHLGHCKHPRCFSSTYSSGANDGLLVTQAGAAVHSLVTFQPRTSTSSAKSLTEQMYGTDAP